MAVFGNHTDGGMFWFPLTDQEASLSMGAIEIDPNQHKYYLCRYR